MTERWDVVVVGGSQAGLAMGYYLAQQGARFVILEVTAGAIAANGAEATPRERAEVRRPPVAMRESTDSTSRTAN